MSDLHRALGDISSIRRQVASSTQFRGYGPAGLAATAAFAAVAAVLQHTLVSDPAQVPLRYVSLWIATAALAATVMVVGVFTRSRRVHSGLSDEMIAMAAQQFLPSIAASCVVTLVLMLTSPHLAWLLPGLWQIIYSLGIFASCRFVPGHMPAAAAWYLITGAGCLALGDARALSPWAMGFPYLVGQTLVAVILYRAYVEDPHED